MVGSNNDINILKRSPVFARLAEGNAPQISYEINGHSYDKDYYLADGIYPSWATLVKTIRNAEDEKSKSFGKEQEAARKNVERAFSMLQSRWGIVRHPARTWSAERIWVLMTGCVIMHNMIIEDGRNDSIYDDDWEFQVELVEPLGGEASWKYFLQMHNSFRDRTTHNHLQADFVEYMWTHVGNQPG
jgi:hypothetical protein